jgi:hypothetical protein
MVCTTPRWRRQSGTNSSLKPNFPASWENTRKFINLWPLRSELPTEIPIRTNALQSEFPAQRNRELIVPEQGIKSAHQGSLLSYYGKTERVRTTVNLRPTT